MGAQRTVNMDQGQGVSFQMGAERAHVLILKPDDLAQRNAILDAVLNLSALKYTYQLVYLAAPRLFGASLDALMFRSRGIGLLFYDERRINEAVPAQPLRSEEQAGPSQRDDRTVVAELATLKTMCLEMERTINQLRCDMTSLRNSHATHEEAARIPSSTQVITTQPYFPQNSMHLGELPSYFVNNPWLDVLSKRGYGERDPIAG